jgi:hypothetical protein
MSIPRLHPIAKTAIQIRMTIKRLEVFISTEQNEEERKVARQLLTKFNDAQKVIPEDYIDVDLKERNN